MTIKILQNPNVPPELQSWYAIEAAKAVRARAQAEAETREAETQRRKQIKEGVEALRRASEEREKQKAEAKRKRDAEALEVFERQRFFENSPGANEGDWQRNRRAVLDEALREGRNPVSAAKERLRASGRYSAF